MANNRSKPWICVGNFNEIGRMLTKKGGRMKQPQRIEYLNTMMMMGASLADLGLKEKQFTWSNKREGEHKVREYIEWELPNLQWLKTFPNSAIFHKHFTGSDHYSLVIALDQYDKTRPKNSKFKSMWIEDDGVTRW